MVVMGMGSDLGFRQGNKKWLFSGDDFYHGLWFAAGTHRCCLGVHYLLFFEATKR